MSNVAEMAELEAAIAEAELTDEEAELAKGVAAEGVPIAEAVAAIIAERSSSGGGPEPELAAGAELGEPTAKQLRDLERETERHLEKARTIMGGHVAGFEPCDHCGGIGLTPPGPRPQEHEYFRACETCAGFGQVKTGSLRQGQEARDCPTCKGRGYVEALDASGQPLADRQGSAPVVVTPPMELAPQAPLPASNGDAAAPTFGTPAWMGDPAIGRS